MKKLAFFAGIFLAIALLAVGAFAPREHPVSAVGGDVDISVTVPPKVGMVLVSPSDGDVVDTRDIVVRVLVEGVTRVVVYIDGEFAGESVVLNGASQLVSVPIRMPSYGPHEIRVVPYDSDGNEITSIQSIIEVRYSPSVDPPDTGYVKIGGLTIGEEDKVFVYAMALFAVAGFVMFIIMRRRQSETDKNKSKKQNKKK